MSSNFCRNGNLIPKPKSLHSLFRMNKSYKWPGTGFHCLLAVLAMAAVVTQPFARGEEARAANLVTNGGFEDGMNGWGYGQWAKLPLPGIIDTSDKAEGHSSFKMGLSGTSGARYIAREIPIQNTGGDRVFSFALKLKNVPEGAARVRLAVDGRGFIHYGDLVRTGGTFDWKTYKFPVTAKEVGDAKKIVLFFYDDAMGSGTIGIDAVSLTDGSLAAGEETNKSAAFGYAGLKLTGDTSSPANSTFAIGQPVELTFTANGIPAEKKNLSLELSIVDEREQPVHRESIPVQPDAKGHWQTKINAPHDKLGFYRVRARLSDGTPLHALGSRPAGFLTYVVVPDPAKRVDYGDEECHFAMQGAPTNAAPLIGSRWVLDDSLFWRRTEPDQAGQFDSDKAQKYLTAPNAGSAVFPMYTLPTLFVAPKWAVVPETLAYETGKLTPEGEKAWAEYCKAAATAYMKKNPNRTHRVYQITWEPIQPWGFKGSDSDLVRIYEIAYPALHETDPKAIVAGPCRGLYNNGDPEATFRLFKLGLGKYVDAYICHPYYTITPEKDNMPESIRSMRARLKQLAGKDLPMYGSEQGWPTDEDITKEVEQAQGLARQNLITLGEGFKVNFAFTFYDYRMSGSRTGYGYYYNLVDGVPFGPAKVCPKPVAPVYAAQSMLLEGSKSAGAIEWLGDKNWGYAFERQDGVTLALWNYGREAKEVSIPTGVKQVHVYDWMGNERAVDTADGSLDLKLGPEPVYVSGVSPKLWGAAGANVISIESARIEGFAGGRISMKGKALMPSDKPFEGSLSVEPESTGLLKAVSSKIALGSDQATPFGFDLDMPPGLRPGSYKLRLRLSDANGKTIKATALTLNIAPPVAVNMDAAFSSAGKPALAVALEEKQGNAISGSMKVSLKELLPGVQRGDAPMIDLVVDPGKTREVPGTSKEVEFNLAAGANNRILVDLAGAEITPTRKYQALVTITTANGNAFSQTASVQFVGAEHMTHPPTVDGDLSEWDAVTPLAVGGVHDVVRSPKSYPPGLSAKFRYAWDERALYIAAEVNDDTFVQERVGGDIWRNDSLQLAFNLDPQLPGHEAVTGDRRTSEITVALTKNGPEAYRDLSYALDKLPAGTLSNDQLQLAVKKTDGGKLTYEMAIPWTTLGLAEGQKFKPDDRIGIAATVNEVRNGNQGDPCALGVFGGITPDKNPDKHGILILK